MYTYEELKEWDNILEDRPYYILDIDKLKENYNKLDMAYKKIYPKFQIAYSYKTNYIPTVCNTLHKLGAYAEVVSDMELYLAEQLEVPYSNIIYNGPYKGNKQYELLKNGGTVIIDNVEQLDAIEEWIVDEAEFVGQVGFRLNLDITPEKVSRFGFDINGKQIVEVLNRVEKNPKLNLKGVHCHVSGARSVKKWEERALSMVDFVKKNLKKVPDFIDLGSGMYGEMEDELAKQFVDSLPSFEEYANAVATIVADSFSHLSDDEKPMLVVEPGTTLVANVIDFVSKIEYVKHIRNRTFLGTNSSMHNLGELCKKKNLPLKVVHKTQAKIPQIIDADIVGYTCIENDVMYRGFNGYVQKGDFIVFENVGSYSVVLKPPFILPQCAILGYKDGKIIKNMIREPERYCDIYRLYSFDI